MEQDHTFCILTDGAPGHDAFYCALDVSANSRKKQFLCFCRGDIVARVSRLFGSFFASRKHSEKTGLSVSVDSTESTNLVIDNVNNAVILVNIFLNVRLQSALFDQETSL